MKHPEAKHLAIRLAKLFPGQVNDGQRTFAVDQFKAFERADVESAIAAHRKARESIDWPALFKACEPPDRSIAAAEVVAGREGNWPDVHRRQNPKLAGASDLEVVLRVHRGWWEQSGKSKAYEDKFRRDSLQHLKNLGMDDATAAQWADVVFAPSETFLEVLLRVRGELVA